MTSWRFRPYCQLSQALINWFKKITMHPVCKFIIDKSFVIFLWYLILEEILTWFINCNDFYLSSFDKRRKKSIFLFTKVQFNINLPTAMQKNSRYRCEKRKASLLIHDKPDSFQETCVFKARIWSVPFIKMHLWNKIFNNVLTSKTLQDFFFFLFWKRRYAWLSKHHKFWSFKVRRFTKDKTKVKKLISWY